MRFLIAAGLLGLAGCAPREELPIIGNVPEFQMVSQDGKVFDSRALAGHVWVADFIFTNCPGPCLRMSSQMHRVQSETASVPDIRLLSFSVDPARDTPPVLAAFASKYQPDAARWFFLTGKPETLQMLSRETFKLGDVDGTMNHSTRFALVDKRGRIRGIYATQDGDPVGKVSAAALQLQKENS
jgi:protein SCO1